MRKWLIFVSVISMVFALAACGGGNNGGNGGGNDAAGNGSETPAPKSIKLTIGAPPASSAVYGYWVAAAKAIETVYPEFSFTITETQGAVDITERVRSGMVPLGNSVSSTDYENYYGEGGFEGDAFKDLRMIWYFDTTPQQWIVTKDSNITSLKDLTGKRFNPGSTNSSAEAITKLVFAELGIEPDYFDAVQADAGDAVVNRQIVGTSKAGPAPDSFIQQIQGSVDIELLGLEQSEVALLIEKYGYLVPYTIPAGTYPGIDRDILTVATMMGAQTTSKLPQEYGYKMIKAIVEDGRQVWADAYPVGANNNIPELTIKSSVPLHAGTVQYLKEIGVDVPSHLIPPEYQE